MKTRKNVMESMIVLLLGGIGLLSGCKVGPNYKTPQTAVPDAWHQQLTQGLAAGQTNLQTWWQGLNDSTLNDLIAQAGQDNLDVKTAASRIRQARAQLGIATGRYYPQVDATGFYLRERPSENGIPSLNDADPANLHNIGLGAAWEPDVFGRISRSVESSRAALEANIENYRDVLVILYSDVAINYIEVRALQARIQYTIDNIDLQRKTLKLTQDRFEAELVPELDVQQALFNLANTESTLPDLRSLQTQAINRLGVLLGQSPGLLSERLLQPAELPLVPADIPAGLPAELLRQRPDIRSAERTLAAQTARIGVATADLYPTFSLSGTFALEAQQIGEVGRWDSRTWGFGPSFRWNIFDGNRIRSNIQFEEALAEEAMMQYQQAVLLALEEVENAMVAYKEEQVKLEALQRSVTASQKSVELVNDLYLNGLTNFQNVLDTQRFLSQQQDKLAASRGLTVQNLVRIYRSLGGGWNPEQDVEQNTFTLQENQNDGQ